MKLAPRIIVTRLSGRAVVVAAATMSLSAAAFLSGQTAFAQAPNEGEGAAQATLTMAQAVTIAETMGNGRATKAKIDDDHAAPRSYKVTVVAPGEAPLKLKIAAAGGRILASERDDDH